jgi:hypothetical protein
VGSRGDGSARKAYSPAGSRTAGRTETRGTRVNRAPPSPTSRPSEVNRHGDARHHGCRIARPGPGRVKTARRTSRAMPVSSVVKSDASVPQLTGRPPEASPSRQRVDRSRPRVRPVAPDPPGASLEVRRSLTTGGQEVGRVGQPDVTRLSAAAASRPAGVASPSHVLNLLGRRAVPARRNGPPRCTNICLGRHTSWRGAPGLRVAARCPAAHS